jgi:hypothetical protein
MKEPMNLPYENLKEQTIKKDNVLKSRLIETSFNWGNAPMAQGRFNNSFDGAAVPRYQKTTSESMIIEKPQVNFI